MDNFLFNGVCKPCKLLIMNFFQYGNLMRFACVLLPLCTSVENDLLLFIADCYRNIELISLQIFSLRVYFTTVSVSIPLVGNI